MELWRLAGYQQDTVTLYNFLRVRANGRMNLKTTLGWERSTSLTRKDPFSVSPSLFPNSNSAQLKLKTRWMITFIISHNEHSCLSCDVIYLDRCVPTINMKLLPIRSLPTRAQTGTPLPPQHPPLSPLLWWPTCRLAAPQLQPLSLFL